MPSRARCLFAAAALFLLAAIECIPMCTARPVAPPPHPPPSSDGDVDFGHLPHRPPFPRHRDSMKRPTVKVLILFDDAGDYGFLGELCSTMASNLVAAFGAYRAAPVSSYVAGDLASYTATIYVGSTFDNPLPSAFISDVIALQGAKVLWIGHNVWHLTNALGGMQPFYDRFGFKWKLYDFGAVSSVVYKGVALKRSPANFNGIMTYWQLNGSFVDPIGVVVPADGSAQYPWGVRSHGSFYYLGENPFLYGATEGDRLLILHDLMYELLAPNTAEEHLALVRIEDVGPTAKPDQLRAIADFLYSQGVPFSVATYPLYQDVTGAYSGGTPTTLKMEDAPDVVAALQYMVSKGGRIVLHGYSHQLDTVMNPFGVSGYDYEFVLSAIDPTGNVQIAGPAHDDDPKWAQDRINSAIKAMRKAKLPDTDIWEFPHYSAGPAATAAAAKAFKYRYERPIYYTGLLKLTPEGKYVVNAKTKIKPSNAVYVPGHNGGQGFVYPTYDVFGSFMIPENLGYYAPNAADAFRRTPADIVRDAALQMGAVRRNVASFFYHAYYGTEGLAPIIAGIQALGYTFVDPLDLVV
eukprot:Opistho-2@62570